MASKKKAYRNPDPYSEETIKKYRKFPILNSILLFFLVLIQLLLACVAIFGDEPEPQDRIKEYEITVEPCENGTLDIEYSFVWQALDPSEELTWVEIGMANEHFTVRSISNTVKSVEKYVDGDYVSLRLDLKQPYKGGETLEFSFRVNQSAMLCKSTDGYFYEFVPGWFNATPVEHYTFRWKDSEGLVSANAQTEAFSYLVWEGSMDCGTYVKMNVRYADSAFLNAATVEYSAFDDSGVCDDLAETRIAGIVFCVIIIVSIVIAEVYIVDSFVSYDRGRGFLSGYGYHIHTYGRVNPKYKKEKDKRAASSGRGGFSGGGCACACACACAGGGRAGCSQKDTYQKK